MTMQLELMTIGKIFYGLLFVAFEFKMDYFFNMVHITYTHKQWPAIENHRTIQA